MTAAKTKAKTGTVASDVEQRAGQVIATQTGFARTARGDGTDTVDVVLAHPISRQDDLNYLGLTEPKGVNETVTVSKAAAKGLIDAGMVQVDPEDVAAVAEALGNDPQVEPDSTSGNA